MDFADFELGRIFGTLLRRWRIVLVTTAFSLALAAIALVFITPQYSAIALVQFDPSTNPLGQSEPTLIATPAQARAESEVEIMRSNAVLIRLLRDQPELTSAEFRVQVRRSGKRKVFRKVSLWTSLCANWQRLSPSSAGD